jgi:hypothetical protein
VAQHLLEEMVLPTEVVVAAVALVTLTVARLLVKSAVTVVLELLSFAICVLLLADK